MSASSLSNRAPLSVSVVAILLFAGEQDLICNSLGIKNLVDDLEYNGMQGFGSAVEQEWFVNGDLAGSWQTARNLTLVKVANASHMVSQIKSEHETMLKRESRCPLMCLW